jgi:hypothetical protein
MSKSKKYKGKLCVYCGRRLASTRDHVWAREFCLLEHRQNLPQVPACEDCNNEKSKLEHYLTTVLLFGARHPNAIVMFETMAAKRLEKNRKLWASLRAGYKAEKIPFESNRIEPFFVFVAKGLLWHHWGVMLGTEDRVAATVWRDNGSVFLDQLFALNVPKRITGNLGGGLAYEGVQLKEHFTLWRFWIYGGLCFAEESKDPNGKHSVIFAVTGPGTSPMWASIFKEELRPAV